MQARMPMLVVMLLAALYSPWAIAPAADARADAPLRVTLNPNVHIGDRLVRVGDVARISGGDAQQRAQIAKLDLLEIGDDESGAQVPRALVEARLLLGGMSSADFHVEGAGAAQV